MSLVTFPSADRPRLCVSICRVTVSSWLNVSESQSFSASGLCMHVEHWWSSQTRGEGIAVDQVPRENKDFRFYVAQLKQPRTWWEDLGPHHCSQEARLLGGFHKRKLHEVGQRRGAWGRMEHSTLSFDCLLRWGGETLHLWMFCSAAELANHSQGCQNRKKDHGKTTVQPHEAGEGTEAKPPTHHHSPKQSGRASWGGLHWPWTQRSLSVVPKDMPPLSSPRIAPSRWKRVYVLNHFSRLFATLWVLACQAPLSMGFSRQEHWSGLPFLSLGDLPNPGINLVLIQSSSKLNP